MAAVFKAISCRSGMERTLAWLGSSCIIQNKLSDITKNNAYKLTQNGKFILSYQERIWRDQNSRPLTLEGGALSIWLLNFFQITRQSKSVNPIQLNMPLNPKQSFIQRIVPACAAPFCRRYTYYGDWSGWFQQRCGTRFRGIRFVIKQTLRLSLEKSQYLASQYLRSFCNNLDIIRLMMDNLRLENIIVERSHLSVKQTVFSRFVIVCDWLATEKTDRVLQSNKRYLFE